MCVGMSGTISEILSQRDHGWVAERKREMSDVLKVFSGKCCLCDVGVDTGATDASGQHIHTGDIVMVYHGDYVGTDLESWNPCGGLTAVVSDQYQSYADGKIEETGNNNPFVMGIRDCGFNDPKWQIRIVKKYFDVIDGEHWKAYGFNYRKVSSPQPSMTEQTNESP
jgi:hypothetical protein